MKNRPVITVWSCLGMLCALVTASNPLWGQERMTAKGHLVQYENRELILVGDSGTHCVMQNLNIDYRAWIDDCAAAGVNAIHIWSFVSPWQTQDGSDITERYGYVYPGITPWARHSDGPLARDGLPRWNLREFDEGDDPNKHYWPRLRDICRYAKQKKILVGITVFFGWPKHHSDWVWHPFNVSNGGHLTGNRQSNHIEATQQIATPGQEMLELPWSETWSNPKKTQWLWERFAAKLLKETQPIGNTFYIFMDERSYSEGNCGDHFADFFRRRNAFWIDGQLRRDNVDGIIDGHGPGRDINQTTRKSLGKKPVRPFFELELPPYKGKVLRHNLYACLLGGGHFFHHNDERQETRQTGIMSYDPNVKNSHLAAVRERINWLGIACRIMNERVNQKSRMVPSNEILTDAEGYCLAVAGSEYLTYIKSGGHATLQLKEEVSSYKVTLINPRDGQLHKAKVSSGNNEIRLELPDNEDWVAIIQKNED